MAHRYAMSMKKALLPRTAPFQATCSPVPRTEPFVVLVPPVRVERTLLAELDFESSASTNSATGAQRGRC